MLFQGDWFAIGAKSKLEADIGNGFKLKLGWIETSTDTAYCEEVPTAKGNEPLYSVTIWNAQGIRARVAAALGQPVNVA